MQQQKSGFYANLQQIMNAVTRSNISRGMQGIYCDIGYMHGYSIMGVE